MLTAMPIILPVSIVAGIAGALARHGQGGAWSRWQAMALYVVCCLPSTWSYLWLGTGPLDWSIGVFLIALFYLDMTMQQEFGNLWLGLARNCAPLLMLFFCTGVWPVLIGIPLIFIALKWAKEPADFDSHKIFEYILGGVTGFCWGAAPLMRAW